MAEEETRWAGGADLPCLVRLLSCVPDCMSFLQPCVFKVDYVVEAIGNKEFGSIFLEANGQKENIALSVVSNGWAKVSFTPYKERDHAVCSLYRLQLVVHVSTRSLYVHFLQVRETGSQQSPYIEDLKRAQEAAQGAGVGLWNKVCDCACNESYMYVAWC